MKAAYVGLGAFGGCSLALMTAATLLWGGSSANGEPPLARYTARPAEAKPIGPQSRGAIVNPQAPEATAQHLVERLGRALGSDSDELATVERELLALGELAAAPLLARLKAEPDRERQRLLVDFLRKIPGSLAEEYFVDQARNAEQGSSRALAMDALADRRTDRALDTLDQIATTDPEVPHRPFIAGPRQRGDDSTELPDEVTFTPRMKAMTALAATGDTRATLTLAQIVRSEPEESLRMEAARNLGQLRGDASAVDALLGALTDPSAYVRLAALHSLAGSSDRRLPPALKQIAGTDSDLGVRALAQRLLSQLASAAD